MLWSKTGYLPLVMYSWTELSFDNRFARLDPAFFESIAPTPLPNPYLVAFNPDAAQLIDLAPNEDSREAAVRFLSGNEPIPGSEPVAMLYGGHQFGVWVRQLGDGRAILLGQVENRRGERWDLHLKGSGPTRFSRRGDGRSVLRSAIREYLCSEAMAGLGIPTTRALAIVGSDLAVQRETVETAATLLRLSPSHIRFGHFEVFADRGQLDRLRELADYVIATSHPDLRESDDRYSSWLTAVVEQTADLIAAWMAVGFAHGVMNTDNMSVDGLTLDYGPFGFMDEYHPDFICNHSDHEGRYAFGQQPGIAIWNLTRFAESLLSLVTPERATASLDRFIPRFSDAYGRRFRQKLGLKEELEGDFELIRDLLDLLHRNRVDYSNWFRALAGVSISVPEPPPGLRAMIPDSGTLDPWLRRYRDRLAAEGSGDEERASAMNAVNPKFVLRNYLAQRAIERAQSKDFTEIERLRRLLADPFRDHPGFDDYAAATPPEAKWLTVSCSS